MTLKAKILDIAMNLNRVGNWAADDYFGKEDKIKTFLANTSDYLEDIKNADIPLSIVGTINTFKKEYQALVSETISDPKDSIIWAEKMMTWGNILTHRSKLI